MYKCIQYGMTIMVGFCFFALFACSKNAVKNPTPEILSEAELFAKSIGQPDESFVRNANYNPSMFAKFSVSAQQAAELESQLNGKKLINLRRSSSPRDFVSWWLPSRGAVEYTYMTSANAPVNVVISSDEKGKTVFIWWSSP